ncbi:TetR/AcrR family transcriptional regulator [Skermania sp. ID1734]|uniref:TetR/AcrR family transcriptional regulator n=1 Tax=Skermania sp. ID1734 TaxID=2597516 RepID=UPI00117CB4C0|nr:TetR/AcrR family transcriptional regulator [Skermania sp. ID1734]TSE00007.1 TetR/AcrR family transcriptional regulator [Skermania sp. ID1734]
MDDAILDAARSCIEDFGVRRTTLVEVARRAGVSRPTVYRRWPDTNALIGDLLTREMRRLVTIPQVGSEITRADIVAAVVEAASSLRTHPMFDKIFRTDADLLLTYVVERLGRSQLALIDLLSAGIAAAQEGGSVRPGDPRQLATMVLLISQSTVQSARMVADTLPPPDLAAELAHAIDGYLAPARPTKDVHS